MNIPSPVGVEDAAAYVERLNLLRIWAGQPSLRRLRELAGTATSPSGHTVDRLPSSTVSDVLSGKRLPSLPRLELVEAFVVACMRARRVPPSAIGAAVEQWFAEWRRLAALTPPRDAADLGDRRGGLNGSAPAGNRPVQARADRPLVGRQDALRDFEEALDDITRGSCRFAVVVGEPGAGKTRLLRELAAIAVRRNMPALYGRAGEFEQELPLGVVIDALDDHLDRKADWVTERLGVVSARLLAGVFPALSGAFAEDAGAGPDWERLARYRAYRTIRQLLEELAVPSGLVLILDDVHWADEDSHELLYHLIRHPPRGQVLIAVAYRPAQVAPRLAGLFESETGRGRVVPAEPLTLGEVRELLGPRFSGEHSRRLYEASGGNPFYLDALARMDGGAAGVDRGEREPDPDGIPRSVVAALQAELVGLSPTAALVARAAALVANDFEAPVVAVAARTDEDVTLAALDEMAARDLIRPVSPAGRFQFRHPLLRSVAYGQAGPGWRYAAHARIAAYLADRGAHVTVRAHHVERSGRSGDDTAVATLVEAARSVAQQAPASAERWLRKALQLMGPDHRDRGLRLDLLLELAQLQMSGGRLSEARNSAREALRSLPADDHTRQARALWLSAMIERLLDRPDDSRVLLLDGLRRLRSHPSAATVPLQLRLVADDLYHGDFEAAQTVLGGVPETSADWEPALRIAVAAMRPMPAFLAGQVAAAGRHIEAADRLITAAPDRHLAECLVPIVWLTWTELFMGRYDSALRRLDRTLPIARSTGQTSYVIMLLSAKSRAGAMLGRLREAAPIAEEAAAIADEIGSRQLRAIAVAQDCLIASWSGRHHTALRHGERAVRDAGTSQEWWSAQARYAWALALINAGRLDQGAAVMENDRFRAAKLDRPSVLSCCEAMARVHAVRRRFSQARLWADRAGKVAHHDLDMNLGFAHLARAHALRAAAPVAAAEHARLAAAAFTAAGHRVDSGRARLCAGTVYAEADEVRRAREQLTYAVETFTACGAHGLRAEALGELNRLG